MRRITLASTICIMAGAIGEPAFADDGNAAAQIAEAGPTGIRSRDFSDVETRGDAQREFTSSWPREAGAIPGLVTVLASRRQAALADQKREWDKAIGDFAGTTCVTCTARSYSEDWEVLADTPRFLSLGLEYRVYAGGAHGFNSFDALIWDKKTAAAMRPIDVFIDPVALENVAYGDYCGILHEMRSKRRGLDPAKGDKFEDCPRISKLIVSASSYGQTGLDHIEFMAPPYVAGPYAEGSYQMTVPVTQQILAAVKPEYRAAFTLGL